MSERDIWVAIAELTGTGLLLAVYGWFQIMRRRRENDEIARQARAPAE